MAWWFQPCSCSKEDPHAAKALDGHVLFAVAVADAANRRQDDALAHRPHARLFAGKVYCGTSSLSGVSSARILIRAAGCAIRDQLVSSQITLRNSL